jgi:hypothetical protein
MAGRMIADAQRLADPPTRELAETLTLRPRGSGAWQWCFL